MLFAEAIAQMQAGNYAQRAGWTDGYCAIMPGMSYVMRFFHQPQVNVGNFLPLIADLLADDWQVVAPGSTVFVDPSAPQEEVLKAA
jgi:hypothetical protein